MFGGWNTDDGSSAATNGLPQGHVFARRTGIAFDNCIGQLKSLGGWTRPRQGSARSDRVHVSPESVQHEQNP
jgi:hypothetical protein